MSDMGMIGGDMADAAMEAPAVEKVTICIEKYADGTFKVGIEPPEGENQGYAEGSAEEETGEDSYMQEARSIDEALDMARTLMETPQGADAEAAKMEDEAFTKTFNQRMGIK